MRISICAQSLRVDAAGARVIWTIAPPAIELARQHALELEIVERLLDRRDRAVGLLRASPRRSLPRRARAAPRRRDSARDLRVPAGRRPARAASCRAAASAPSSGRPRSSAARRSSRAPRSSGACGRRQSNLRSSATFAESSFSCARTARTSVPSIAMARTCLSRLARATQLDEVGVWPSATG